MLKLSDYRVSEGQLELVACIDAKADGLWLQELFCSAVADHFGRELRFGFRFDQQLQKVTHHLAFDYPKGEFFTLSYNSGFRSVILRSSQESRSVEAEEDLVWGGPLPPKVTNVKPLEDWKLHLTFETGRAASHGYETLYERCV